MPLSDFAELALALLFLSLTCTAWLFWALGRRSVLVGLGALADQSRALERLRRMELEQADAAGFELSVTVIDEIDDARERFEILTDARRRLAR